jgi:hypothetical protein
MTDTAIPPQVTLQRYVSGFQTTQVIYVAARIGVADLLADGPRTAQWLAGPTGAQPQALDRLLRMLAALGVVAREDDGSYSLTTLGAHLRTGVPGSFRSRALFFGDQATWGAWGALAHCIETGESGYEHVFGMTAWEYRERHPDAGALFNDIMTELTDGTGPMVAKHYDFPSTGTVVDVGGGHGRMLAAILASKPGLCGILFDLPQVVGGGSQVLSELGVLDRCEIVGGDIFAELPAGHEIYILARVLHDWPDADVARILARCRAAMPISGRLLIVERMVGAETDFVVAMSDLTMLVGTGGRERSGVEFESLLREAGLRVSRIIPMASALAIIEAESVLDGAV